MVYRFIVGSEEAENFKLEIEIDSEDTFLRLRNVILEAVGYDKSQIDSFYICDEDWHRTKEVTYADMGADDDDDIWLMEETTLEELFDEEGQRLKFVFDYMNDRYFWLRLKETMPGKTMHDPLCTRKAGTAPKENLEPERAMPTATKVPDVTDLDADFYGSDGFNDDELGDLESFEGEEPLE